ncbi:MAG TPA: DUF2232 domain-containing protein [Desulfomonilia bacterium]|nr:DUF2232 domain-containing protein [Desulfomonilia bacterium]
MGIFLILSLLIVTATEIAALPAVVIFPAMYCFYADRVQLRWPMLIACAPLVLALVPAFSLGATVYAVILVSAGMMHFFLKRGSIGLSVAAPSLLIFIIIAASILSFSQSNGLQVGEVLNRWAADVTIQMGKVSQNALSSSELSEFREKIPVFQERIVELFPSIILTSVAVIMWLNLLIIKWRYRAMAVREWKCPDWVIAFFILAAVLTIVPQKYLQTIGLNLLIIVGQVYLFQGLAIVSVFMDERKWPSVLRWPIYILILIQIYIIVIVAGFGLFDTWFDFRKRIRTPKGDIQ